MHFCILHRCDNRQLHDKKPVNMLKGMTFVSKMVVRPSGFFGGMKDEASDEGWRRGMTTAMALEQIFMVWAVSFDAPIQIFDDVSEVGDLLMLFYGVWCFEMWIDML